MPEDLSEAEARILRLTRMSIARGVHRSGDILPDPEVVARAAVISPRKVEAIYARLAAAGLVILMEGHGYMVVAGAATRAQGLVLQEFLAAARGLVDEARAHGCSWPDIEHALSALVDVSA